MVRCTTVSSIRVHWESIPDFITSAASTTTVGGRFSLFTAACPGGIIVTTTTILSRISYHCGPRIIYISPYDDRSSSHGYDDESESKQLRGNVYDILRHYGYDSIVKAVDRQDTIPIRYGGSDDAKTTFSDRG